MTPEHLVYLVSSGLSIALEYIPKLRDWYDAKSVDAKRTLMLVLLAVGSVVVVVAPCYDVVDVNLECVATSFADGAVKSVLLFLQAIAVNQGVHRLTKRKRDNASTG